MSFSIIITLLLILATLTFFQIQSLSYKNIQLNTLTKNSLKYSSSLIRTLAETNFLSQRVLIDSSVNLRRMEIWENEIDPIIDSLRITKHQWNLSEIRLKFEILAIQIKKLQKIQEEVEELFEMELTRSVSTATEEEVVFLQRVNTKNVLNKKLFEQIREVDKLFKKWQALLQQDLENKQEGIRSSLQTFYWVEVLLLLLVCSGIVIIGSLLSNKITQRVYQIRDYVWAFGKGNIPETIESSRDEIGDVMEGLQELGQNLIKIKEFASTVSDGDFDRSINIFNNEGELGQALIQMHEGLVNVALRDKQRNWINEGIALFSNLLREYNDEQVLYDTLISNLVKYLEVNQGEIFVLNDREEEPVLELKSVYAYNRKRFVEKKIMPGQGLVGQAWREKDTIYLEKASEQYVQIVSGLGGANPRSILILPMINNNSEVLGVLELASFKAFAPYQINFVSRVGEMIVTTISSVKNNEKTHLLLKESQKATELMKKQEQEMRKNLDELLLTQKEMTKNQDELSGQRAAIDTTLATVELDIDGMILNVNEIFLELFGYTLEEIKDEHHSVLLDDKEANSTAYIKFWETLCEGKPQTKEVKRITKEQREIWLQSTYTPVRDNRGKIYKIITLSLEITKEKEMSILYQSQLKTIHKSNAVIEFNIDGRILSANELYLRMMGCKLDEITGRHYRMFVTEDEQITPAHTAFWEKLQNGECISGRFKRKKKNGEIVWLRGSYNPVTDLYGALDKVFVLMQEITTEMEKRETLEKENKGLKEKQQAFAEHNQKLQEIQQVLKLQLKELKVSKNRMEKRCAEVQGQLAAISTTTAIVEMAMDGTILNANELFLEWTKYELSEVRGADHSLFVPKEENTHTNYDVLWAELKKGNTQSGIFKRLTKEGQEIWLKVSYAPVKDVKGYPYKIIKLAVQTNPQNVL